MGGLFIINDEFEKKLHPEARKIFHNWNIDIQRQVQLTELNNDDLEYLRFDDMIKLKRILEIPSCLNKCTDVKDVDAVYDVYFGDIYLRKGIVSQLERDLLNIELDIVPPLRRIYEGRVAKAKEEERKRIEEEKRKKAEAEEEQKKRDEEARRQMAKAEEEQRQRQEAAESEQQAKEEKERWHAALEAVNPPLEDAKIYLSDQEYDQFKEAAVDAIGVYLEKKEGYLHDMRTFDYRWLLDMINSRKAEQRRKDAAYAAAREFNNSLNEQIAELRARLVSKPIDLRAYFTTAIKDERYRDDHHFNFVLSKAELKDLDRALVAVANKRLEQCIPESLRQFIVIPPQYHRIYYPLPSVTYSVTGVPCLDISFDIFAAAYAEVSLKPMEKKFGDYIYRLPWIEEKDSVELKEPELLGYYYLALTSEDLDGHFFWKTIPLVLLKGLLNGEVQTTSAIVIVADENSTTYRIPEFKEEVNIPDCFASYLKSIGSIGEMINKRRVTEKVGSIIKIDLDEFKAEQETSLSKDRIERKDSNKAKAFRHFDEGGIPSDREIKALGIKPKTSYNYYQQWKKLTR